MTKSNPAMVKKFKSLLKKRGVRLVDLQEFVGISKSTYSLFINGKQMSKYTIMGIKHWMETGEKKHFKFVRDVKAQSKKDREFMLKNKDSWRWQRKLEAERLRKLKRRYPDGVWQIKAIELVLKKEASCQEEEKKYLKRRLQYLRKKLGLQES